MATHNTLTPRQAEIKALLDKNQTPKQIAKRLKITENGVYQHLRRIRAAGGSAKPAGKPAAKAKPAKPAAKRRTTTRRPSGRKASAPAPTPAPAREPRHTTPLDAISQRREEIERTLASTAAALEAAKAAYDDALAEHDGAQANHRDELAQLDRAEAVLKGVPAKPERKSAGKARATANGKGQADHVPAPEPQAAPEPEPQAEPTPAEPAGEPVAAEEPVARREPVAQREPEPEPALIGEPEFERPGAETLVEFAQEAPDEATFGDS